MDELTGRTIDGRRGRYRVERELGRGGMGVVYLARELGRGTACALKMLRPELTHDPRVRRRFVDEAKALMLLDHPNIVKALEYFCVGEDCFIALAFVDGASLSHRIQRQGPLPEAQALRLFKPVLSALDHGHQKGIVHRDVKPNNILIDRAGTPMLCDFGIAKQVAERGVTLSGVTLGTAEYMSPEQVQTPDRVDHRSDVYAAGIVLFEMLTGRVPFTAGADDSDFAVRRQHVQSEAPNPATINPHVGPGLAHIVLKALRKNPDRRHAGCAAFRQAIERYEQGDIGHVPEPPPREPEPAPAPAPAPAAAAPARRSYRVYEHPTLGHLAVKQGFSWPASLGSIFWMFRKGLYPQAAKWAAAYVVVFFVLAETGSDDLLNVLSWAAIPVLWVAPGFVGNAWREHDLRRRGFELKGAFAAETADGAVARATRGR